MNEPIAPAELDALQGLVLLRMGDARRLPDIATTYLTLDLDSPALRELAGLDLDKPVDPYDARDLFWDAIDQLEASRLPTEEAGERVAYLYARLIKRHEISPRRATRLFSHLAVQLAYPAEPPEIIQLYGLDNMWDLGVTDDSSIEHDILNAARQLVQQHETDQAALTDNAIDRLAHMLTP